MNVQQYLVSLLRSERVESLNNYTTDMFSFFDNTWISFLIITFVLYCSTLVLYTNSDQTLPNKLHGPMHYKLGVTCVYNGHVFYTLL